MGARMTRAPIDDDANVPEVLPPVFGPRDTYRHACGRDTRIGPELAATFAREPAQFPETLCLPCGKHFPAREFRWVERSGKLGPVVGSLFRAGDVVRVKTPHLEETWVLACDQSNGRVWACGWPCSAVDLGSLIDPITVELVEAATDEKRWKTLTDVAAIKGDDPRVAIATEQRRRTLEANTRAGVEQVARDLGITPDMIAVLPPNIEAHQAMHGAPKLDLEDAWEGAVEAFNADPGNRAPLADGQQRRHVTLDDATLAAAPRVRPVRDSYRHEKCGSITRMPQKVAETYAAKPDAYHSTWCATCHDYLPVGAKGEFVWLDDGTKVGT